MTRIAVLSTAHIHTRGFLDGIAASDDGRAATVVWDDVPERGKRYAEEFGARFEGDLGQVLADDAVDAFLICAENTRHLDLLEAVVPVGKPIMCEKPVLTTGTDVRALVALRAEHPTPIVTGYFQPYGGTMNRVALMVGNREFGEITRVRFRNAHHAAYGRWFDNPDLAWFTDPELSGGGAFMDMGTHAIQLLRTLFGPVDRVWARIENHCGAYPACDDYGFALLEFRNGILGQVEAAWTQTGGPKGLEIVGSHGALWNQDGGYVTGGPGCKPRPVPAGAPRPDRVDRLVAVQRGEVSPEEVERELVHSLDAVAIMEAAYASAEFGGWADVPRM